MKTVTFIYLWAFVTASWANPYPDPSQVPVDNPQTHFFHIKMAKEQVKTPQHFSNAVAEVFRVEIDWSRGEKGEEQYSLGRVIKEHSGTPSLHKRAKRKDPLGSYHAIVYARDRQTKAYYASIGTGRKFRRLNHSLAFRFPAITWDFRLALWAENPQSGIQEKVFDQVIPLNSIKEVAKHKPDVRLLKEATKSPSLVLTIYAEGYNQKSREKFFAEAKKVVDAFENKKFPKREHFEFRGVFMPSNKKLGKAQNLGKRVERDSFLGLYHPYWEPFGRWYHVVYPTNVTKYRDGLAQSSYDYPIILIDSKEYWGVGNYNQLTAVPSQNRSFTYLLMHEFGHFLGLNEEYNGGGPTELEFAEGIEEPWSQNITFNPVPGKLKWQQFVAPSTPVPTPHSYWDRKLTLGAYEGGYADSKPLGRSHVPGLSCTMVSSPKFCRVCAHAMAQKIDFDLGL